MGTAAGTQLKSAGLCCNSRYVNNNYEFEINSGSNPYQDYEEYKNGPDTHRENLPKVSAGLENLRQGINEPNNSNANKSQSDNYDAEYLNRITELANIVHFAPLLTLKVISSGILDKGTTVKINAQGVENSPRSAKDGYSYFGYQKVTRKFNKITQQTEDHYVNDYIIPAKDKESAQRHKGRHFQVEFHIPTQTYRIKDLGVGYGAFVKLEHPLILKDNHLLNVGESFLVINLLEDDEDSTTVSPLNSRRDKVVESPQRAPRLRVKIFGGPNTGDCFYFTAPLENGCIKIGRRNNCEIQVEDNLLSKYQCTIKFLPEEGWILIDGTEKRPSTNGTWLYMNDDFEIYNGIIFKANQTLFQAFLE